VRAYDSSYDAFAAKLSSSGSLTWNTFLGGTSDETNSGIALDSSGNVYVGGESTGTWGAPLSAFGGGANDAFAVKLDNSGNLTWNTFVGGSGDDVGVGFAADSSGNVFVGGYSTATWGAPVRAYTGSNDAYAAKLNTSGTLIWNTFLDGSGSDAGLGIAVNSSGAVYVGSNSTASWGSPVNPYTSGTDAYVAKLNSSGSLLWHTFLGGTGSDTGNSVAADNSGNAYLVGGSGATWGSPVRAYSSGQDASVAKLNDPDSTSLCAPQSTFNGSTTVTNGDAFYLNCFYGHVHVVEYGNHYRGAVTLSSSGITVCLQAPAGYEAIGATCFSDKEGGRKDFFIRLISSPQSASIKGIAVGAGGGTFTFFPWQVIIPANLLPNGSTLQLEFFFGAVPNFPDGLRLFARVATARIFNNAGVEIKSFTPPLQVCYLFSDAELQSVGNDAKNFLILMSSDNKPWEELMTTPDLANKRVCANVSHFSLFEMSTRIPTRIPATGDVSSPMWLVAAALLGGAGVGWLATRRKAVV
jgi:LPXTG-motif cell wall-anchored protein